MNENEGFLQAILANPDDDQLRLIYADWLEERGDPRGEFIRVQMELTGPSPEPRRAHELLVRERELLTAHEAAWLGPLRMDLQGWTFRRGFLHEVEMTVSAFLEHAAVLFATAPVRGLRAHRVFGWVGDLAKCPYLAQLQKLDFANFGFTPLRQDWVENLSRSPHLTSLRILELPGLAVDMHGVRALAAAPALGGLNHLRLTGNDIGDLGLHAILASPHLTNLRHLFLEQCDITNTGMTTLARSDLLNQIETLALGNNDKIDNRGVRALTGSRRLGNLRALWLAGLPINGLGIRAIAECKQLAQLTELDLSHIHISDSGADSLIASPYLDNLASLNLTKSWGISPAAKQRLQERFGNRVVL